MGAVQVQVVRAKCSRILTLLAAGVSAACSDDPVPALAPASTAPRITAPDVAVLAPPVLTAVSAEVNPQNSLSALITFRASGAASIRVRVAGPDGDSTETPLAPAGSGSIAVVGLAPRTTYHYVVEALGPGGSVRSDGVSLSTGELPAALEKIRLRTKGSVPEGFVLTGVNRPGQTGYGVAFDRAGEIRWYQAADQGVHAVNARQEPDGNFTMFSGMTLGWQPEFGRHVEFDRAGRELCDFDAGGRYTDGHDLLLTWRDGSIDRIHLIGYGMRPADLTGIPGGSRAGTLVGHQILRLTPEGELEFLWDSWDHFTLDDWIEKPANISDSGSADFDHPNSLALDRDGNYIVSWRNLSEIDKIDARTGALLWRLGGRNNQFTFVNDPLNGFSTQHSARITSTGTLLLYDNGTHHAPPRSRAVEYALDPLARTATMVFEYRHEPGIFTPFAGSAQRLSNGGTLVVFSSAGRVVEVGADGGVVWEGVVTDDTEPVVLYSAYRVPSLYVYQAP